MNAFFVVLGLIASYLIGSLTFGIWVAKLKGVDITAVGSNNPGATNIWRVLGWKLGSLVFFLDFGKGFLPSWFMFQATGSANLTILVGLCAVLGHTFPLYNGFKKGGKAVATGIGMLMVCQLQVALAAICLFCLVLALTRVLLGKGQVWMASITGAWIAGISQFFVTDPVLVRGVIFLMAFWVIVRHASNIKKYRSEHARN
ncbi:MAG: hypothetical protein K0S20_599 [Patescibacteria group bacterium]|jgi:glycerol-3-phosphate acyltransferase PlsY|nr:hypothetical protein [Patescibacteria group bacterium]